MPRAGKLTGNAALEAINGWLKEELFSDFHLVGRETIELEIERYIKFFNEEHPAYALEYLAPKQHKGEYMETTINI